MSVNGQPVAPRIVLGKGIQRARGAQTILPTALTGEDSPNAVAVQKETPTAVQVLRTISVGKIRDVQPYLRLRRDGLYITPTVGNADVAPLLEQLKSDPNLRAFVKPGTTPG